ncbi:hypothetical protein PV10_01756 [Exophiala mesophila]|uniref:rRNA-processing protein FYV7 n=1 Tax=Exophiala mesophila TaxID=212818 RepID=A0A0D1YBQ9_EXOME|nr:uncharacterized protein PV10_01756 [Exophiala mesophila]KIV98066.1 hypothetical protein PV10_01756 [Exophiala mesophila]
MSPKRLREDDRVVAADRPKRAKSSGFSVGPANLPDGTYRRKTQKIKKDLIQKAKVKKAYAKIKAQSQNENPQPDPPRILSEPGEAAQPHSPPAPAASLELHPERQALLNEEPKSRQKQHRLNSSHNLHSARPKTSSYHKELEVGAQRRAEIAANADARLARDRERRAMAKAKRPGKDGKAKLGRQGTALLTRIQRLTAEGKI